MVLQLFIFALVFIVFGFIAVLKKKSFLGWAFILLGIFVTVIGMIVVFLYPQTLPF